MSRLTLKFLGATVDLWRAARGNHPRERIEFPEVTQNQNGSVIRDGLSFSPPHLWDCSFLCTPAEAETLIILHQAWCDAPGSWVVWDTITPFSEAGPRTRAIVPATSEWTGPGGRTVYFAQFLAEPISAISVEEQGVWRQVGFRLRETLPTEAG